MRKFFPVAFAVPMLLLTVACSTVPRVVADVDVQLPGRSADSVMIFEPGQDMPAVAREVGRVKVMDGGMVPAYDCLYGNMLALAVKKTAESGGNALRIDEHRTPNFWTSNCHRIWGTMLLLPDSLVEVDVLTSLQKIEMEQDLELLDMAKQQAERLRKSSMTPANTVKINIGPSGLVSKFQLGDRLYDSKTGFTYGLEYPDGVELKKDEFYGIQRVNLTGGLRYYF